MAAAPPNRILRRSVTLAGSRGLSCSGVNRAIRISSGPAPWFGRKTFNSFRFGRRPAPKLPVAPRLPGGGTADAGPPAPGKRGVPVQISAGGMK